MSSDVSTPYRAITIFLSKQISFWNTNPTVRFRRSAGGIKCRPSFLNFKLGHYPGRSLGQSLTLLRGAQGALFPVPGAHRLRVEVTWSLEGVLTCVKGETQIMVTEPVDDAHAQAAARINCSPDALLSLAIGGDHLEEGNAAIDAALSHPVLRPHYAVIKAKRLGRRTGSRAADVLAACELLGETAVLSDAEIQRVAEFLLKAEQPRQTETVKRTAAILKERIAKLEAENDVVQLVNQLDATLLKS